MDGNRFDDIARALASGRAGTASRRTFLGGLAGGVLGAALGRRAADAACPPDQIARRGACFCRATGRPPDASGACPCPRGQTRCGAVCVDLSADAANCGTCGQTCASGQACLRGACACTGRSCPTGCCDGSGQCRVDDDAACGTGGGACMACTGIGQTCGGGGQAGVCGCTDDGQACAGRVCGTATNNCGQEVSCGPLGGGCPPGQGCTETGTCVCPPGTCGEGCAHVICADQSCGQGAGDQCAADSDCCSGVCVADACLGGCVAENGVCDSGGDCCGGALCTTAGGSGDQFCCASGRACGIHCCASPLQVCDLTGACCTPATCVAGQCGSHGDGCGGSIDCGGCTAPDTCGGGGTPGVCGTCTSQPTATTCAGTCGSVLDNCGREVECACSGDLECCAGVCVDLQNDPDNCRECGRVCASNPVTCTAGTCQGGTCVFSTVIDCCQSDDDCDDGGDSSLCTIGVCDPQTLTCRPAPVADNTTCPDGVCCAGTCLDVSRDAVNCGACGHTCVANQPGRSADRCQTGTCSFGVCDEAITICGSCATPACDPDKGGICVNNCPPPDACHTGEGVCQLDGTCTYEPKCPCQECDSSTGDCSGPGCSVNEFCIDNACVDGLVCPGIDTSSADGTLCPPTDTCEVIWLAPLETGCCPSGATRCPLPALVGDYDLCCPAGDTCGTQTVEGTTVPYCRSIGQFCPSPDDETAVVNCLPNETCAIVIDPTFSDGQPSCCPADGVLCDVIPGSGGYQLCCPAGDTCETAEILGTTFPTCSSIGTYCPTPGGGPATICDPDHTCTLTKFGVGGIEIGCCPPDGVICTLNLGSDLPGGSPTEPGTGGFPTVPGFELPELELCCPAGDTCMIEFAGLLFWPRCSSDGGTCLGPDGAITCGPDEPCAITNYDPSTGTAEFGCCPANGVICGVGDFEGLPSFLTLCCPEGDSCETLSGPGSFPRCSSTPPS
jgi:hypothetical protein